MVGMNLCVLEGHLAGAPEIQELDPESRTCAFNIKCRRRYNSNEAVEGIEVVTHGRLAEVCNKYLSKGSHVLVSGMLKKSYEGNIYVEGREVKFLPVSASK